MIKSISEFIAWWCDAFDKAGVDPCGACKEFSFAQRRSSCSLARGGEKSRRPVSRTRRFVMITSQHAGQVITFYSFKGGTGRSMAVWPISLCSWRGTNGQQRVLMMDWDLEAPGLHRFFQDQLRPVTDKGRDATQVVDERLGLIDLFLELDSSLRGSSCREEDAHRLLSQIDLDRYILQTRVPGLHLLKAGRFDSCYISRVSSFQWDAF